MREFSEPSHHAPPAARSLDSRPRRDTWANRLAALALRATTLLDAGGDVAQTSTAPNSKEAKGVIYDEMASQDGARTTGHLRRHSRLSSLPKTSGAEGGPDL